MTARRRRNCRRWKSAVTGNDRRITRYTLGTSNRSLAPGERFGFSSRLDVPRNGVKTVSVTFAG